ncbi:LANO_0F05556g1_1 [Lachancea nothofagi CBS 11611]|uniref:Exocyst complex protein EXO70 n=1 Tax=Lachancea nothofagi CBS 11611 TaxID=1266666 RepID=A0A1G4K880_9SACH|nr:LANO_0F05556g1_1 [Lachancea nothofagi CBS 11611]
MSKYDVDGADVLVLRDKLDKFSRLSLGINKSLENIGRTTIQSSKLFTPIVQSNTRLGILQKNIESSLEAISSIKDLANDASKHELVLTQGISKVGLRPYIKAIRKLQDIQYSMDYQKEMSPESNEFQGVRTHLSQIVQSSEDELKAYVTSILRKIEPFDPQIMLNNKVPFPYYEDEDIAELTSILSYFGKSGGPSVTAIIANNRSQLILKSLAFLEPFVKQVTDNPNVPYRKGSSGFLNYNEALLGFIANEYTLTGDLYPQNPNSQAEVFASIMAPIMSNYVKLTSLNLNLIKSNLSNFGLFTFELAECIASVLKLIKNKPLENNLALEQCHQEATSILYSLFRDLISYIEGKAAQLSQLPSDNGVIESTIDVMSRLRKFSEYKQGCLNCVAGMRRDEWLPKDFNEKEYTLQDRQAITQAALLLSCFFSDCIDCLVVSLERRAQRLLMPNHEPDIANPNSARNTYKQRIGFFLITNITLIEQIVSRSELSSILGEQGNARLEKLKKRYVSYFVSDWRTLTSNLLDAVFVDSSGKVSSKDKDQIKEKFKKFNDGFEELASNFKHFRISDPTMKKLLKSEVNSLVLPLYERFHGRYKDSFKNPRKHIKYTPSELATVLNSLDR